ncbi:hypothetical protein CCM_05018 [Cordyceps militaris CM01]|uniref:Uncharacterized protein n=1 Tax=Cordyceps militaris (strain CM01) TaxID=983644 RepID=G3JG25_CORMM|nr:uncharacterized protein CCM_05018 [Cordyceps militaris CM01]EGX93643.1 hypothetical protein CCM_05018 [Cordyceps militaris CM01]
MALAPSTLQLYDRMLNVCKTCVGQLATKFQQWTDLDRIDPEDDRLYWRPHGQEYGRWSELYLTLVALQITLCCEVFRLGANYSPLADSLRHIKLPFPTAELCAVSTQLELTALGLDSAWSTLEARRQVLEFLMEPDTKEKYLVELAQLKWTIGMHQCAGEIVREIDRSLRKWISKAEE